MTEAQSKRTRLKVWSDVLVNAGGTPAYNDTLYQTIRKAALASGISMQCCTQLPLLILAKDILEAAGGTPTYNDTLYSVERKLAIALGANIGCCNMPPMQAIPISGGIIGIGTILGDPNAQEGLGDPGSGVVFGQP